MSPGSTDTRSSWLKRARDARHAARLADAGPLAFIFGWWKFLLSLLVLLTVVYVAFTWPLVRHMDTVPDAGDPLLNTWALSWIAHQAPIAPARLVHANIFYPERYTLLYSESLLLPGLMSAPLQWLGVNPVVVYNVALAAGIIFSGVGIALLILELTGDAPAAVVGAIAFAFLPFRVDHFSHMQLQQTQWIPVALWALHRTVRRRTVADAVMLGVATACQLFSCVYFALMLLPFLAAVAVVLVGAHVRFTKTLQSLSLAVSRPFAAGIVTCTLVSALVAGALVAPLGMAYISASHIVGERVDGEALAGSAVPSDYLAAPPASVWYANATSAFGGIEHRLFPGVALVLFAAIAAWRRRSASTFAYLVALAVAIDMSFGLHGVTFSVLWNKVSVFRGLRVPARMGLFAGLALCVLAAMGVASLRTNATLWTRRLVPTLAAAVIAIESWVHIPPGIEMPRTIPPAYEAILADLAGAPTTAIADLPIAAAMPSYMYYSTFHWQNLLSGYSGFFPPSFLDLTRLLEQFPDPDSLDALRRRRAQYVVLHGEVFRPDEYTQLVARADASPELTLLSTTQWMGAEMRVYKLRMPDAP